MTTMGTPQRELGAAGRAPSAGPPAPSGTSRAAGIGVIAVIAALLGGVVGYVLRPSLEPTVTRTVTNTATQTVAPPAYATGEFGAAVVFDGTACMYNGPAEQPAGTRVAFSFTGPGGSSLLLWKVMSGTTYEDAAKSLLVFGGGPFTVGERFVSSPAGARHQQLEMNLGEGLWLVGCTTHPSPPGGRVLTATMLRVVKG
jgi:hypothetical protein